MYKFLILTLLCLISKTAYAFENTFAVNTNLAQVLVGGISLGVEYNPDHLPVLFEVFVANSRERPGDDLIAQNYTGLKISYNMTGADGFDNGLLVRGGAEDVKLDYYWDDKSQCTFGCPGNNFRSKKGSAQFTRYNFGLGVQSKTLTNFNFFGREIFILFRLFLEKNFSGRDQVDAVDRAGNPIQENLSQFNNYSAFINLGLIF